MSKRASGAFARLVFGAVGLAISGSAMATNFPEVEPNDTKAAANVVVGMQPGDTLTGLSTGASTTVAGDGSADNFDITTAAAPTAGIYRYRLVITTLGTAGHTGTIRGLTQTAGVVNPGTDSAMQTSSTTSSPPRFVQWYANETPSRIIYRVTGGTTTTTAYTVTLEREAVTPSVVPTPITAGGVFVSTIGQTTGDTDLWVYDQNFAAIPLAGNDDYTVAGGGPGTGLQSRLQRDLAPGTYYVAIANYNLANNLPLSVIDENGPVDPVMDFPNALVTSSTAVNADNDFEIGHRCVGSSQILTNTRVGIFDVTIWQFTLVGPSVAAPVTFSAGTATPATVAPGGSTLLSATVFGGTAPPGTVTANLTAFGLSAAEVFVDPDLDGVWTYNLTVPVGQPGSAYNVVVTGPAGACSTAPTRTIVVTVPVANDACISAEPITVGSAIIGSTGSATNETPVPPTCNGLSTFNLGVWYTFTEGATARRLQATTCDPATNFNTRLYVYSGSCAALTCINANAVAAPACAARADAATVVWCTTPGTQYFLLVTNDTTLTGAFGLSLTDTGSGCAPPPNDDCGNGIVINSVPFNASPFVDTATPDIDVSCNAAANITSRGGVWYRYTPSEPGNFAFTETGAADVIFTVFTGDCGSLSEVYCNTNEAGTAPFAGTPGTLYHILVSMASDTAALPPNYALTINYVATPGACCNGTSCTLTNGSAACVSGGGTFQGYGTNCGGGPLPENFNDTDFAMPDFVLANGPVSVSSTITVTDASVINDLDVYVTINHTFVGDVYLRLLGPNGTTVDLLKRPNIVSPCTAGVIGDADDLVGTYVFDDDAAGTLHAATIDADATVVIANGHYIPSTCTGTPTSLDAASPAGFGGISAAGVWTLIASDEDEAVLGTLQGFGLVINGVQANTPCTVTTGACCCGANCSITTSAACTGSNRAFVNGSTCTPFSNTAPCCRGDYNKTGAPATVQDIFDFLSGYFSNDACANTNDSVGANNGVSVQDIFDYLSAYFGGGC